MWAARNGTTACVDILLPVSDPLARDNDGWTALMYAADGGYEACLQLLLPVSDISTKNNQENTASEVAPQNGHPSLVKTIEAYALAQSEKLALHSVIPTGVSQKRSLLRI